MPLHGIRRIASAASGSKSTRSYLELMPVMQDKPPRGGKRLDAKSRVSVLALRVD
jgi:hypothetical protein